ncbi:hypothetical protein GT204_01520 [Streptomyces sp. SID4919]|uniref:hypothetical protein n=1 Tax=unclassified Streptomyces TaxID=2593676 RepID=UPI000823CBD6|nr:MULTISPECIES: hypothetical protein [unclassified Streptomyces]MYY07607.1 hypothetical protein [Streptomyces sp. SID4919]SCK52324.1 hypothetical protein YW7DRAFT_04753 [Streptomyces sp. AmelKG-E11A]
MAGLERGPAGDVLVQDVVLALVGGQPGCRWLSQPSLEPCAEDPFRDIGPLSVITLSADHGR